MPSYSYILREVPVPARPAVAQLLGRLFNLKDTTCANIAESAPIVLLTDLEQDEAAVLVVVLRCLARAGALTQMVEGYPDDLSKIDWPRRPQIFRRDLSDYITDFQFIPPGSPSSLLALCGGALPGAAPVSTPAVPANTPGTREFKKMALPEITPFGGASILPPPPSTPVTRSQQRPTTDRVMASPNAMSEASSRLDELFPEDESSGFVPNNQDITSILNKLLPDEDSPSVASASSSGRRAAVNTPSGGSGAIGHAVFLAKIADEGRRQKAIPLIAELAKISTEDADALSKKVIIPVLKGATKDEAEAAKVLFAKIGILARVKGPDA
jgi:hypothetical protein